MNLGFRLLSKYRKPIMAFAALWVIAFHYWDILAAARFYETEKIIKGIGFAGVDIFLLLSGYGLFYSMESSDKVLPFYKKRFARICFPVVIIAVAQAVCMGWSVETLFKNVVGYNFLTENIYSYLWFVYFIVILYLIFPLYYRLFRRAGNKLAFTLIVFGVWLGASLLLKDTLRYDLWGVTNRIPVFALGVYYGYLSKRGDDVIPPQGWILLAIALAVGIVLAISTNWHGMYLLVPTSNCCVPNFLIAASLPLIMSAFFELLRGGAADIFMRCASFLGDISFELYCVQDLVRFVLIRLFPKLHGLGWNAALYACVILCAAALFYMKKLCGQAVKRLGKAEAHAANDDKQ